MEKLNKCLLLVAVFTSILFLTIVESFNDITLDDIGFALQLQNKSIWNFIKEMYLTWQGRFMAFFISGVQIKSYFLFKSMLPVSILLYVLNIILVSKSLSNFFKIKTINSFFYAILLFQLYVYSMLDISSYFWLCTKGYTLVISLSLFAFSELTTNSRLNWYDYIILFITFAFLGCSYEIYAPLILLFMGCVLFYRFYLNKFSFSALILQNKKLVFSIIISILFFTLMIIAPGNWVRMNVHSKDANLAFSDYMTIVGKDSLLLIKFLFFKIHYFLVAGLFILAICQNQGLSSNRERCKKDPVKRILFYVLISLGLCFLTVLLNTYAIGDRIIPRAFNHLNLICFLFIGFSLYEMVSSGLISKMPTFIFTISIVFVIICNIYCTLRNVPELEQYRTSVNHRMEQLKLFDKNGNKETIKLKELDVAEYHSVDDLLKLVIPRFSTHDLLKANEVSNNIDNFYNKTYRKYYNLHFDVITDLYYGL